MTTKKLLKISLLSLSLFLLTACKGGEAEPADQVIQKSKKAIAQMESGQIKLGVGVDGQDVNESLNLDVNLEIDFDKRNAATRKVSLEAGVKGSSTLQGNELNGKAQMGIVVLGEDFYVRLNELDVSDPSVQAIQPFLKAYMGKWLHVASDFIPENIRNFSKKDSAAIAREEELQRLFVESNVIRVTKEFGVETVNGEKVYHYGIEFDEVGLKDYMRKAALINQPELTDTDLQRMESELDQSISLANDISSAEVWLGMDDYLPYKASLVMEGVEGDTLNQGVSMRMAIDFEGEKFNEDPKIETPTGAEEFNPLSLLIGVGDIPVAPAQ